MKVCSEGLLHLVCLKSGRVPSLSGKKANATLWLKAADRDEFETTSDVWTLSCVAGT